MAARCSQSQPTQDTQQNDTYEVQQENSTNIVFYYDYNCYVLLEQATIVTKTCA